MFARCDDGVLRCLAYPTKCGMTNATDPVGHLIGVKSVLSLAWVSYESTREQRRNSIRSSSSARAFEHE